MTKEPISKTAKRVESYLLGFYAQNEYMPTLAELAQAFGRSREYMRRCLLLLEAKGRIKKIPRKHRGIEITLKADTQ